MLAASRPRDEKPKDRLGLQHRADVASAAPGRGLATADILTGGRTILGVGRGYHTREVETFGAPMLNQEASRKLFEEQVAQFDLHFHLAKTREQAIREITPIHEEHVKMFAPLGFVPGLAAREILSPRIHAVRASPHILAVAR